MANKKKTLKKSPKKNLQKMDMGGALSSLAPLLGMIPGIGGALSMGAGLIGGIGGQLKTDQDESELWNKENKVKGNTPTGTLGLPNYRKGGPLNLGGPGIPESQLLDVGALPTPDVLSAQDVEKLRTAEWDNAFKGTALEEAAKAAGIKKGVKKYSKEKTDYEKYLNTYNTTSSQYNVDDSIVSPMSAEEFYEEQRAKTLSAENYRNKQAEGKEMKQATVQKLARLQGSLDQFQNISPELNRKVEQIDTFNDIYSQLGNAESPELGNFKSKNIHSGGYTDNYAPYDWSLSGREQTAGGAGSNEIGMNPSNTGIGINTNVVGADFVPGANKKVITGMEDTSPELPAFKYGGKMNYKNGGGILKQYNGPKHEQGGIPVDAMGNSTNNTNNQIAEVEGGETSKDNYVFSDSLLNPNTGNTFAEDSKMTNKKYKRGVQGDYLKANTRELEFKKLAAKNSDIKEKMAKVQAELGGQPQPGVPQFADGGPLFGNDPELTGLTTSPFMQALGLTNNTGVPTATDPITGLQLPTKYPTGIYSVGTSSVDVPAGETYKSLLQSQARDNMKGNILTDSPLETSMIPADELAKRNQVTVPEGLGATGLPGINTNVTSNVNSVLANNNTNTGGTPFDISKIVPQVNPLAPKIGTAPGMGVLDPNAKPGDVTEGNAKATLGDKIQAASNFLSPAFNLATSLTGYDKEPEIKNKYGREALNILKNAKIRPDYNPLLGQANATKTAITSGATGPQRLASLLGLSNQTTNALASAAIQTANQNVALDQQYAQTALGLGEKDRTEGVRAKGTTDANKAQQFNMMSKAFEQLGPAIGTIGSGMNQRQENVMTYNLMKQIMPDMSLEDFNTFMKSQGNKAVKYVGGVKSFAADKTT